MGGVVTDKVLDVLVVLRCLTGFLNLAINDFIARREKIRKTLLVLGLISVVLAIKVAVSLVSMTVSEYEYRQV